MNKKIFICLVLSFCLIFSSIVFAKEQEANNQNLDIMAKAAILMEQTTGEVLYEKNPDERLSPASVTKVMTLYLIYEAIEQGKIKWDDEVSISEYASSMGGSQIFLEPNEKQTVETLTKSIAIASANDAAVAMAEHISGSEEKFVELMNNKAKELGMKNSNFENACGLDTQTTNHYMSARDIAIISRELMSKYPQIKNFTTRWQDTIVHKTKNGETDFGLTNTNRLLKTYEGATGLKTGSTQKALYCLSATAERDGQSLVAVILGAPDPKARFNETAKLLDYGFANFKVLTVDKKGKEIGKTNVYKGNMPFVIGELKDDVNFVVKKDKIKDIETKVEMIENISAPINKGAKLGEVIYFSDGKELGRAEVVARDKVDKATLIDTLKNLIIDWVA